MFGRWLQITLFLVLCLLGTAPVLAQVDTGTIVGTVLDNAGAAVPGATLTLRKVETGVERHGTSGSNGSFSFSPLEIGTYRLEVQLPGFQSFVQDNIGIVAQADVRLDVKLSVGAVTEVIEVTSAPPQLETQTSSLQQVLGEQRINDLPLNGRNATFLAQTAAGVTYAQADSRGLQASGSFSANGSRRGQNNYLLDGIDNNTAIADYVNQTQYVIMPPPDALAEFVVQTNNYTAEFGHSAGAVLNASTAQGTDHLHGRLWEYLRNDALDARNYFATLPQKPALHQNQFGGSVGGPVVIPHVYNGHGKTFFFFDAQRQVLTQNATRISTVPTLAEQQSNFSDLRDLITNQTGTRTDQLGRVFNNGTVFDPSTSRAVTAGKVDPVTKLTATQSGYVRDPFYNGTVGAQKDFTTAQQVALLNQIPGRRIDPNALKLLQLFPNPTIAGIKNNYTSLPEVINNNIGFDLRVDQHFSEHDSAFARYSYLDTDQTNPGPFPGLADGQANRPGNGATQAQNVAVSETHIFSSRLVNEARAGYSRVADVRQQLFANQTDIPQQYGITGIPQVPGNGGLPAFAFGALNNLGQASSLPSNKASDITQVSDNLTISRGNHVVRTGLLFQHIAYPTSTPSFSRGQFSYSGIYTSIVTQPDSTTDRAQFVLTPTATTVAGGINNVGGANALSASSFPPISNVSRSYTGVYVQDDWRATSKLTFNPGLRWEYYRPPTEASDRQANFVPGPLGSSNVGAAFYIPNSQLANVPAAFAALLAKDNIALVGTDNRALTVAQKLNFAPRFGVAYQASQKVVVHAGFGLFYGGSENIGLSGTPPANFPFNVATSYTAANGVSPLAANNSVGTLENGLSNVPLTPGNAQLSNITLIGRPYRLASAYTEAFNAQVQYQPFSTTVVKVAYVGSQSRHLQTSVPSNSLSVILPSTANAQTNSLFPDFARGGSFVTQEGMTNYNGLQVDVITRYRQNLVLQGNYTRSKCLGDSRDTLDNTIGGYRAPYVVGGGLGIDYTLCDVDVRNIAHFNGTYRLPFGNGQRFLTDGLASHLAGGFSLQFIANVQDGQPFSVACPNTTTAGLNCFATLVPGTSPYSGLHNVTQFLNPAAFTQPSTAQTGFALLGGPGGQVTGPPNRRLDLSLFRQIGLAEHTSLQLRAEAFNLTNTPNFGNPTGLNFNSPTTFAPLTTTLGTARQIQLAAKFLF